MLFAFDFNNTLIDIKKVASDKELEAYRLHLEDFMTTGHYKPLLLPMSWVDAPLFPDVRQGLVQLYAQGHRLVTFTNSPTPLTLEWIARHQLPFHSITSLEPYKVFKPHPVAYSLLPHHYGYPANQICVVTANYSFGDLKGAVNAGMFAQHIDRNNRRGNQSNSCRSIIDLAEQMKAPTRADRMMRELRDAGVTE